MASETKFKETEIGMIPEDWDIVKFGKTLTDGTKNGIYKQKEFHGHGSKIVNMGELFAYPRLYSVPMKRLELTNSEIENFSLKEDDLLFARRSLVAEGAGKCSIVREVNEPTVFESSILRARPDSKKANSLYLYYLFNSKYGLYLLNTIRRQVAVAGITGKDLQNLQIPLPSLSEQKVIANVLSFFDDKIELNHQINKTLEQIAQTLFKHWFIDFEFPDENGNPYKSSGGRMEDSELGEIPEGWRVGQIKDLVNHFKKSVKPQEEPDKLFHHYSIPAYDFGKVPEREFGSKIMSNKFKVVSNSILVSKLNPETERVWNVGYVDESLSICSTELQVFVSKQESWKSFVYFLFKSDKIREEMVCRVTGTSKSHQRISPQDILNIQIILPTKELILEFGNIFNVILKRINCNLSEAENLSQIRDSLLPKLMSGKIRVEC